MKLLAFLIKGSRVCSDSVANITAGVPEDMDLSGVVNRGVSLKLDVGKLW